MLALFGAHHILRVSRIRVKSLFYLTRRNLILLPHETDKGVVLYAQKLQTLNRNSISLFLFSNCEVLFYVANIPASSLAFRNWTDNSVSGSYMTGNKFRTRVKCSGLPRKCRVYVCLTVHRPAMIPAGYVIDAHAQHFVVNDEKLLLMLKTYTEYTRSLQATRYASRFHCV